MRSSDPARYAHLGSLGRSRRLPSAASRLAVSAASCWEVAWLARRGRLELKMDLDEWLDQALQGSHVECVPLDRSIAVRAARLSEHHRDPLDRFIIATAIERQTSVISFDAAFPAYVELTGRLIDR